MKAEFEIQDEGDIEILRLINNYQIKREQGGHKHTPLIREFIRGNVAKLCKHLASGNYGEFEMEVKE